MDYYVSYDRLENGLVDWSEEIPQSVKRQHKIDQILNDPDIGEPKSYGMKGVRGVHIDPFVIVYMIVGDCIVFLYVAHHDEIYGKTKEIMQKDHTIELLKRINRLYPYL